MKRVGLNGVGAVGSGHARNLNDIPSCELLAICDINPSQADKFGRQYQAKVYNEPHDLISDPDVDVVDICTPTTTHKDLVIAAARAGKQVICEKPMARTLPECREMIAECEKAGVGLYIAQVVRFFPEFAKAKEMLDKGAVGTPAVARTTRGGRYPRGSGDWFTDISKSGGVILDMLVHDFDWHRWCFGDAQKVYAKALTYRNLDHCDYALVTIVFQSGVIAHIEGTWAHYDTFRVDIEVTGSAGMIEFHNHAAMPLRTYTKPEGDAPATAILDNPAAKNPYYLELEHFIDCMAGRADPIVLPEDGMKAVEIALAALESAKTGEPVELPMGS